MKNNIISKLLQHYQITIAMVSIFLILLISFIIQGEAWEGFGEWAANLLVLTLLIGPTNSIWNKYIKKFFKENINDKKILNTITKPIDKILKLALKYRRQLGITTFWLAAIHGMSFGTIYYLENGKLFMFSDPPLWGIFGLITLILLFIGFVTSNNFSQRFLGKYWKKIQTFASYGALLMLSMHLNFMEPGEGISYLILFVVLIGGKWRKVF